MKPGVVWTGEPIPEMVKPVLLCSVGRASSKTSSRVKMEVTLFRVHSYTLSGCQEIRSRWYKYWRPYIQDKFQHHFSTVVHLFQKKKHTNDKSIWVLEVGGGGNTSEVTAPPPTPHTN